MKFTTLPIVVLLAALAAASCSRAQARVVPDLPPLDVPSPPPRVVEVQDPETLAPGTLVGEPARNTPRPRPPAPAKPDPARTDTAKPEPPPSTEPAPVAADEPTRAPGAPTLQTTPPGNAQDVERTVKTLIEQAKSTLSRVDFNRLNPGARTQYNDALRMINTAEEALRERNLLFAHFNADKAATIAGQLSGR
jgi:hypothetical protein